MKRFQTLILTLMVFALFAGCAPASTTPTATPSAVAAQTMTAEPTATLAATESAQPITTATPEATTKPVTSGLTVDSIITEIGKTIKVADISAKNFQMIGAVDGKCFWVGDNSFEVYKFDDAAKLEEAKTGKLKLFADLSSDCSVNGSFVMIYKVAKDDVINAFLAVK